MPWIASIFIGCLTAVVGAVGAGGLGILCVEWYRIPGREGTSGYYVIFIGLVGAVFGLIAGLICARIVASGTNPGFVHGLGVAMGWTIGPVAIATLICWLIADLPTTLRGKAVDLHAEVRCPPGFVIPSEESEETWYAHIDTRSRRSTSRGRLRLQEARQENGRWIIPMTLRLETSVREKLLYVRLAEVTEMFVPRFPAKPGSRYLKWSDWQDGGWDPAKPRPSPEERFNLRFRIEVVPPKEPPPARVGPSDDEIYAQAIAQEEAALVALTPDSPLEESLKFTHYTQAEERRKHAGEIIGRRSNVVAELSAEILSSSPETADRALRALAFIKPLPPELKSAVDIVGDTVLARLREFNASKPEDDPRYQGAADVAVCFSSWFQAQRALHESAGVNGLPMLEKVLELAEERKDSVVLKSDVVRIARHYIKEWSAAPLVGK